MAPQSDDVDGAQLLQEEHTSQFSGEENSGRGSYFDSDSHFLHRLTQQRVSRNRLRRATLSIYLLAGLYILTVCVGAVLFFRLRKEYRQCRQLDLFPSLASVPSVVNFKRMKLPVKMSHNPFVGDPSQELDHAWHELFEDVNIRVSREDLKLAELESLRLADGSGDFIGQLGVHHELHCLKRVRQWIYRAHYLPNLTDAEYTENKVHIDHCIELLRVTTMCRADTSLSTFAWLDTTDGKAVTETRDVAYHSCVNYERLMDWVRTRSLNLFDESLLERPDT